MNKTKLFRGKAIYQPAGKAAEYSKWAVNFYNGCSAKCEYCYNRHGITAKILGADKPTLKKCLKDAETAINIFEIELHQNLQELREHGLFFNFVSDPCLPETYNLNRRAFVLCLFNDVPIKILTKQAWWVQGFISEATSAGTFLNKHIWRAKERFAIGFTLTGHDELEPGAASNEDRIRAIKVLYDKGFKTWASIEPIIDIGSSLNMIGEVCNHVDLIKVGLQSGKKYIQFNLKDMIRRIESMSDIYGFKVYFKDSFLSQAWIKRADLPDFCVYRDFDIFKT